MWQLDRSNSSNLAMGQIKDRNDMLFKGFIGFLILLALGIGWLLYLANRNEARAEFRTPMSGQLVNADGKMVHVKIDGSGPPLVLLHGASGNLRDLTMGLTPALSDRFTTIAMDRPGLGYSEAFSRQGATLEQQAAVLAAAVKELGYDRIYLLGQSLGGSVALQWALDYPDMVAGLVLVSAPSNVWDTELGTLYKINANPVTGPLLRLVVSAFPPNNLVQKSLEEVFAPEPISQGCAARLGIGLTLRRATQRANALQVAALKSHVRLLVPRYGELDMPVQVVHGLADTVVPYEVHTAKLANQIRDITVTALPNVGHMPHHTHIDSVVQAVDALHSQVGLRP